MQRVEPRSIVGFLDQISVLILTYNEEPNLARTLAPLAPFPEIIVLDSGSTDDTCDIARTFPNVRVEKRSFDDHASQWMHGLRRCGIEREWVLALDADFVLSESLVEEIAALEPRPDVAGYRVHFRYCIEGRALSGALYPPLVVLYRRECARYVQHGHTQRVLLDGDVLSLKGKADHDDRKPLSRWISSQQRYAVLEAEHLLSTPANLLRLTDRIRRVGWAAPLLVFFYTLVVKSCLLDGLPGLMYVMQRTFAEVLISLEILSRKLKRLDGAIRRGNRRA